MPLKPSALHATQAPASHLHSVSFNPVAQVLTFTNRDERLDHAQSALDQARVHLRALYAERAKWLGDAQVELQRKLQWLAGEIDAKGLAVEKALGVYQAQQSAWIQMHVDGPTDAQLVSDQFDKVRETLTSYEWQHRFHASLCDKYVVLKEQNDQLLQVASNAYRERIDAAQSKVSKFSSRVKSISTEPHDRPDELSSCATRFDGDADETDVVLVDATQSEKGLHDDGIGSPLVTWMDSVPELDAADWHFILSGDEDLLAAPSLQPTPEMDCAQLLACDLGADTPHWSYFGAMH